MRNEGVGDDVEKLPGPGQKAICELRSPLVATLHCADNQLAAEMQGRTVRASEIDRYSLQ